MQKSKTNKNHTSHLARLTSDSRGITLVALVITIIVMLILVGVTIAVAINGGLIDKTKESADKTKLGADRDTLSAAVIAAMNNQGIIEKAQDIQDNLPDGWTVEDNADGTYKATSPNLNVFTVESNGNISVEGEEPENPSNPETSDLELLRKYFVGNNLMDLMGEDAFVNNEIIPDAATSIKTSSAGGGVDDLELDGGTKLYIKYNNRVYEINTQVVIEEGYVVREVNFVYEPKNDEGKHVLYSYTGNKDDEKLWRIIYDDGENIEIVSPEVMGSLTLGVDDEETVGNTDIEKAIYSYNNAITRINNYCAGLVTNSNKISVRSVGASSDDSGYRQSENLQIWHNGDYNNKIKDYDRNYKEDLIRMGFHDELKTGVEYWVATRYVSENWLNTAEFLVRSFPVDNLALSGLGEKDLIKINEKVVSTQSVTFGVRPIVKLSKDSVEVVD